MTMITGVSLAEVGSLIGDVARAHMLTALTEGRALTAGELAWRARVTASTASAHLAKMTEAGLLAVLKQGRHRYYRLASPEVARMLESMMTVAAIHGAPRHRPPSRIDQALQQARTCYDHLAGRLGVALADTLTERRYVILTEDGGSLTEAGQAFLSDFGLNISPTKSNQRRFCRPCLDWSERRHHIAGAVGVALASHLFEIGWLQHGKGSRAVTVTADGRNGLAKTFGVSGF